MAKTQEEPVTEFGRLLKRKELKREAVAEALGITRQYVLKLAQGDYSKGSPSWDLRERIRDWAYENYGARVRVDGWPKGA